MTVTVLGSSESVSRSSTDFSLYYYLIGLLGFAVLGVLVLLRKRSSAQSLKVLQQNTLRATQRNPQLYMVQKRRTTTTSQKTLEERVDGAILSKIEQKVDELK